MMHGRREMGNVTCDFGAAEWTSYDSNVPVSEDAGVGVRWGMYNCSGKRVEAWNRGEVGLWKETACDNKMVEFSCLWGLPTRRPSNHPFIIAIWPLHTRNPATQAQYTRFEKFVSVGSQVFPNLHSGGEHGGAGWPREIREGAPVFGEIYSHWRTAKLGVRRP